MSDELIFDNPEPVPTASQLAALPFLAAVDGLLQQNGEVPNLRLTFHRVLNRAGDGYLQQLCSYLPDNRQWRKKVGRIFPVDRGIMGEAFKSKKTWRTKHFESEADLRNILGQEKVDESAQTLSWLAIPFIGPADQVVLILYAECSVFNFFADDQTVSRISAMSAGFCRLFDWLQLEPFGTMRNYPLEHGNPITGASMGVYSVQELFTGCAPPKFKNVASFNYEAAVA